MNNKAKKVKVEKKKKNKFKEQIKKEVVKIKTSNNKGKQKTTVINKAKYRFQTPPIYPSRAIKRGQEGTVIFNVKININGLPTEFKIVQSSGYGILDKNAKNAIEQWQFEPTYIDGKTVESWVKVPVTFKLKN